MKKAIFLVVCSMFLATSALMAANASNVKVTRIKINHYRTIKGRIIVTAGCAVPAVNRRKATIVRRGAVPITIKFAGGPACKIVRIR